MPLLRFKSKPEFKTITSGSNSETNFPISPPTSNSSGDRRSPDAFVLSATEENDMAVEEELDDRDDSLRSLENFTLMDIGPIDDSGMQTIIEEVMTERDDAMGNEENVSPPTNIKIEVPEIIIPKLTQEKKPNKRCPLMNVTNNENEKVVKVPKQKKKLVGGSPRKNKVIILKQITTDNHNKRELDAVRLPPVKKVKLNEAEIANLLQQASSLPVMQKSASETRKVDEIERELLAVEKIYGWEEEKPFSVDNPRQFKELECLEAGYIGDLERTFQEMDKLSDTDPIVYPKPNLKVKRNLEYIQVMDELLKTESQPKAKVEPKPKSKAERHLEFMKKLDEWGVVGSDSTHHLDGFNQDERFLIKSDLEELGVPEDWEDEEMFRDLDSRTEAESVFRYSWLPKFSLKICKDNYRDKLRILNKIDPEFNFVW